MSKEIEAQRRSAVIHHGAETCKEKFLELLDEFSVPRCVFQVAEVEGAELEELGFNRATGFFWIKQKAKTQRKMGKTASVYYDVQVTGFIEDRHMFKITGVKGKERSPAFPFCEIVVGYPTADKVKCVSTAGIYRVSPISAFHI